MGNSGPRRDCTFSDGTYVLFLLSLSASILSDSNSTRKQNYMMNFSRQHGLRHFYNRRRRSLRRYPWRIKKFIFPSNMWRVAFHSLKSRTPSDIRKFLWRTQWFTESPSQDRVYHFPTLWTNDKWLIFSQVNVFMLMCPWKLWSVVISVTVAVLENKK